MIVNSLYFYILIFIIIFVKLFIENFNKEYVPFVPKPIKGGYPIKTKLHFAFVRSFFRALFVTLMLYIIYLLFSEAFSFGYKLFHNLSSLFISSDYTTLQEFVVKSFNQLLNVPANTYYSSLVIATMFSIYNITVFIFTYIKLFIYEINEQLSSLKEKPKLRFSLDKEISEILNPSLEGLESFHYEKSFVYKRFIFSENLSHLVSINILWNIQENQSINLYIFIISLLIITYSSMLRVISEYLYIIKDKLTLIHKIQIYVVSVVIPFSTIILGCVYLENNLYYLVYGLIIIAIYSVATLHFGVNFKEKMQEKIKKWMITEKILKKFAYRIK